MTRAIQVSIDILIPIRNESEFLPELLLSLSELSIPKEIKVRFIFSDNCSTDDSYQILNQSGLQNKVLFKQKTDIGGIGNFLFLLKNIESDNFMFLDGHDKLSSNYLVEFRNAYLSGYPNKYMFIGDVTPLIEYKNFFNSSDVQKRFRFKKSALIRKFQSVLFLYHNSIWHSIFPSDIIDENTMLSIKTLSLDHLLTYIGLANYQLKYLDNAIYFRRYRKILGPDFTHIIANNKVSRTERATGEINSLLDDKNIGFCLSKIEKFEKNMIMRIFLSRLVSMKFKKSGFSFFVFRIARFIFNFLFKLNPI
jgi:hypothetical protein